MIPGNLRRLQHCKNPDLQQLVNICYNGFEHHVAVNMSKTSEQLKRHSVPILGGMYTITTETELNNSFHFILSNIVIMQNMKRADIPALFSANAEYKNANQDKAKTHHI